MNAKELSQLYYLNREIETDRKRLERLKALASSPSGSNLTGMPISGGYDRRLERYMEEIADLEVIIAAKITQCMRERRRLERYIADIPDSLTRQIFTLRFVNGLSWAQVAFSVGGWLYRRRCKDGVQSIYQEKQRANKINFFWFCSFCSLVLCYNGIVKNQPGRKPD